MTMRLGVYVLGATDARERQMIEAHLPGCPDCRARLASLAPLPEMLDHVPKRWVSGQPALVREVAGQRPPPVAVNGAHRTRRDPTGPRGRAPAAGRPKRSWRLAAASAAAALAVGLVGGFWLLPHAAGASPSKTVTAVNPVTHVQATAALTATSWGTSIELIADGLPVDELCWLVVRSRAGATEVDGYWQAAGDGPVTVPGSVAWQPSDIASVQVVTNTDVLVTIPVSPTGTT
jgi:hypothetical protein